MVKDHAGAIFEAIGVILHVPTLEQEQSISRAADKFELPMEGTQPMPADLRKAREVLGARLRFRDVSVADADFILSLRLDPAKNAHLSSTSPDRLAQQRWLEAYQSDDTQVYFIIEDASRKAVGTVRLYDASGDSFCWGSWILSDEAPTSSAVESTLMVYEFGFACGFHSAHFDVRRGNDRVWQYHERFGAHRVGEDDENLYYEIDEEAIRHSLHYYRSRIPNGVVIAWD